MADLWPERIDAVAPDAVEIRWDDGLITRHTWRRLRAECRCAFCRDEMTGQRTLDVDAIPADIRPLEISVVGNYGLRILWSDQHGTGIYHFGLLRELAESTPPVPPDSGNRA